MIMKEIKVPEIGSNKFEVTEIIVNIGDEINIEDPIITIEGDKTSVEIPATEAGIVKKIFVKIGEKVTTGSLIMLIEDKHSKNLLNQNNNQYSINKKNVCHIKEHPAKKENYINQNISFENKQFLSENENIHTTPLVRRLAKKFNLNLFNIQGTGRKKRILKEDIYFYIKNAIVYFDKNINNFSNKKEINKNIVSEKTQEIVFTKIQKSTINNLHKSWINIPHITIYDKVDITSLEQFRKLKNLELNQKEKANIKITLLIFLLKAISHALKKFPIFNSSISFDSQKLILRKFINIGIAVDTHAGLIVPVINDVNKKNIFDLSNELLLLINKCREKKLSLKNIQNNCFTISNLGGLGSTFFSPIVNLPEVAILGISKSKIEPIWDGKKFIPKLMLPLSLSCDHRVINGADSVRFMNYIIYLMQDIRNLLI